MILRNIPQGERVDMGLITLSEKFGNSDSHSTPRLAYRHITPLRFSNSHPSSDRLFCLSIFVSHARPARLIFFFSPVFTLPFPPVPQLRGNTFLDHHLIYHNETFVLFDQDFERGTTRGFCAALSHASAINYALN